MVMMPCVIFVKERNVHTIIEICDDKTTTTTFQNLLKGNEIQTLGLKEIDASFRLQKKTISIQ